MKILFRSLQTKLKTLDSPFARNVGWLGGSGAIIRVFRLLATIILARFLSPHDYGLAAVVLTTNEFVRVFTRNGIGIRLIQAEENQLEALAQSAYWLNWAIFIGLFVIQCLAAFPIAWFYSDNSLIVPICGMAFNLLLLPLAMVQAALIQREGRFKAIALVIVPLVLLQSFLAPFYVPIIFGQKWIAAIPILILICLSAIPRPFADSASQLLLAVDKPEIDLVWNLLFTGLFAIGLLIGVHWQSVGVATAVLLTHCLCLPVFAVWATRYVFSRQKLHQGC